MHTGAACVKSLIQPCIKESASLMPWAATVDVTFTCVLVSGCMFCFPGVGKTHSSTHTQTHRHAHSCWDRCGNTCLCAYWVTSGRRMCVSWLWAFFFAWKFKVCLQMCWKSNQVSLRKHKNTAVCCFGGFWEDRWMENKSRGENRVRSPARSYLEAHTHKVNESSVSVWKGFKRL